MKFLGVVYAIAVGLNIVNAKGKGTSAALASVKRGSSGSKSTASDKSFGFTESKSESRNGTSEQTEYDPEKGTNAETQLLQRVLHHYDSRARPVIKSADPLCIRFVLMLRQLINVDIKEQRMSASVYSVMYWNDVFLQWNSSAWDDIEELRIPITDIWRPDVVMQNSVAESFDNSYKGYAVVRHDGQIRWTPVTVAQASCKTDATYFPFDEQVCEFKYGTLYSDKATVDIHVVDIDGLFEYVPSSEWKVNSFSGARSEVKFPGTEHPFVFATYTVKMQRYVKFGLIHYIVPCIIVCIMALMVFILPPDAGEKVGLSVTVLLTVVVFLQLLADQTPPTCDHDPSPVIAVFFLLSMALVLASCIIAVISLAFHHRNPCLQPPMPRTFRKVFLEIIPMIVRMIPPGLDKPPSFIDVFLTTRPHFQIELIDGEKPCHHGGRLEEVESTNDTHWVCPSSFDENYRRLQTATDQMPSKEEFLKLSRVQEMGQILNTGEQILEEVKKINNRFERADEEEEVLNQWKFAAMALDRLCFYIFTMFLTIVFSKCLMTYFEDKTVDHKGHEE